MVWFKVTWQEPVPLQAPPHPVKAQPDAGVALRVTGVLSRYLWLHVPGQLMKPSVLVTTPSPLVVTVSVL